MNNGGAIQMTNALSAAEAVPPPQIEDYGAAKKLCFSHRKKLKKVVSANKIKGFLHAARPKKVVFGLPERAWTYRGHI